MTNSNILRHISHAATRARAALFFTLLLMFLLLAVSAQAQTETPAVVEESPTKTTTTNAVERATQQATSGKSVVRGRAVYDDTNRPVRRARVMLLEMSSRGGPERTGMTNGSGEFQVKDVPAGSYFVMVDAAGIITPLSLIDLEEASAEKPNLDEIKKHFDEIVVDGTNDVTVKVRARRGGAISGKVTYADGDPAINVRVSVMRKKDGRMARFITNLNPSAFFGIQTDDRGMYRIAGLPPGEYFVSASETVDHTDGRGGREDYMGMGMFGGNSLVVTYYQGTTKASSATSLQVDAGQEHNEINITLVERGMHRLSGTVVARRDSSPLNSARITIKSKDDTTTTFPYMGGGPDTSTDEQGRFTLNEIPDGAYTVTVEPPYAGEEVNTDSEEQSPTLPQPTQTPKRKFTRKQQDVTINGSDVTDLTITIMEGASMSGIVTVEGGRPLPSQIFVTLEDASGGGVAESSQYVQSDGKFMIDGLPSGALYMDVLMADAGQHYVKTMTAGGVDLMRDPVVVSEGMNINNVRIVLSPDGATLSGRVLSATNTPVSGAQLVLIPTDQSRWRAHRSFLFETSAADGSYSIIGAPGEYLIIFLRAADQPRAVNEAWIRERAQSAQRVTLQPGERKNMDLTAPAP
jgi:hypothetical protein